VHLAGTFEDLQFIARLALAEPAYFFRYNGERGSLEWRGGWRRGDYE